ncbi:partitioning defective 3 homolog isoform X2 [Tachypleus tridentatus]|uniref:partitioning defective 3 homolog isoform X2 n=1 Tax=Tachypleus tridentatus TaxID=6853 RepID=UPI003FD2C893
MKVTVNFGDIGVIVPCGDGSILVRDLMELAITRYKKALAKNSWVTILKLKSSSDGGILDPDDQLSHVADDREQIIAVYKEDPSSCSSHNIEKDIRSGFSDTDSLATFSGNKLDIVQEDEDSCSSTDVEITAAQISSGSSVLQVRRGSEPALNSLVPLETETISESPTAVPSTLVNNLSHDGSSKHAEKSMDKPEPMSLDNSTTTDEEITGFLSFGACSSARKSLFLNGVDATRWREAAQQLMQSPEVKREESPEGLTAQTEEDNEKIISLKYEPGPLGIHVVPGHDSDGRNTGLVIQGVEPGSRVDRDGRLQVGDRIVCINGQSLFHVTFQKAQEIFKNALKDQEVCIQFRTGTEPSLKNFLLSPENVSSQEKSETSENSEMEEIGKEPSSASYSKGQPGSFGQKNLLLASNTRKMGRKLDLKLTKGSDGLGFSITTRDNPAGGHCPIYIKNILPKGAAVQDGRLKTGDRLLEFFWLSYYVTCAITNLSKLSHQVSHWNIACTVNGIKMTGLSQADAATILRNISPGGTVHLVLSRQDVDPPRKLGDSVGIYPWLHKEVLTFDVPVADTELAGLGVSVKGRTSVNSTGPVDLGIFVKSVIYGGAAFKDGRLKPNDQLLNINGISLLNMTNTEAMKTLRKAVAPEEGPNIVPCAITVKIARRVSTLSVVDTEGDSQGSPKKNCLNDSVFSSGSDIRCKFSEGNMIQNSSIQMEYTGSESFGKEKEESLLKNHSNVCKPKFNSNFDENTNKKEKYLNQVISPLNTSRNPVIDQLTGQKSQIQTDRTTLFYNESYFCSSRERLGDKQLYKSICDQTKLVGSTYSDLVQSPIVMIEVESLHENQLACGKHRPGTPEHFLSTPRTNHEREDNHHEENGCTVSIIASHIPGDDGNPFNLSRDGFGRQSVSEKRNAHLDVHNVDTLQKKKHVREERENPKQIQSEKKGTVETEHWTQGETTENHKLSHYPCCKDQVSEENHTDGNVKQPQIRPFLGMRKSNSLESLQTIKQELTREETTDDKETAGDQPLEGTLQTETQNEASENGSLINSRNHGCASLAAVFSFSSGTGHILDEVLSPHRKSSKQSKKKGLWKGLGAVFKVGKNKKAQEVIKISQEVIEEGEIDKTRKTKQQEKILKQYQELVDRDRKYLAVYGSARFPSPSTSNYFLTRSPTVITGKLRERQLEQLHAKHQKNQGHYVKNEMEEPYEKEIKGAIVQQPVLLYH